jgi:hypothetical protein
MGTRWNGDSTLYSGYESADLRFGIRSCWSEFQYLRRKCVVSNEQRSWISDHNYTFSLYLYLRSLEGRGICQKNGRSQLFRSAAGFG